MNDQELRQALSELPEERAGEDFTARVLERLDSQAAPEPKQSPDWLGAGWLAHGWAVPAAAALGTVLVLGLLVALLSAWPGGLFGGTTDSVASAPEGVGGASEAASEGSSPRVPSSRMPDLRTPDAGALLPELAATSPSGAAESLRRDPRQESWRSLRAQQLLAEQRRLSQELVELRRQMNQEPAVLMSGADGERLLVPLVQEDLRAGGLRREAPARWASFDSRSGPGSRAPSRADSNRPVRVVPASVTTF